MLPQAYVGLATVGAAGGYHGWKAPVSGTQNVWWSANGAAVEGRWVLSSGLGFGIRMIDGTVAFALDDNWAVQQLFGAFTEFAPSILWVAHHDRHGFGFLELQLMPYTKLSLMSDSGYASGAALDYAYVPWAPVPIETHVRLAGTVYSWNPVGQIGYQASAGIRIGLGWWFMQYDRPFRM